MKIAIEGCCHGELDKIYETIAAIEARDKVKVDLLICCGDFQAVRNPSDLRCMAVSDKYKDLRTFYKYYSGEKKAPVLTLFIGGNHEASNYLQELPYGGWVAPNIYYLGYAGVVKFGGIRIAGVSGIYKAYNYTKGHFEHVPYNEHSKRSVYHVRNLEVFRLKQMQEHIDILFSHDWPTNVTDYGNVKWLVRRKKHFEEEISQRTLGSPPNEELLHHLKPSYWFAGHLHVKFPAVVQHEDNKQTKFLALDKCLPKRDFLQVIDIPHDSNIPLTLCLDPEWLTILKLTNHLLKITCANTYMPGPGSNERYDFRITEEEKKVVEKDFGGFFEIPKNFERTAPTYVAPPSGAKVKDQGPPPKMYINPQTTLLCEMLGLTDPNAVFLGKSGVQEVKFDLNSSVNPDEISLEDEEEDSVSDDEVPDTSAYISEQSFANDSSILNPAEISLDDETQETVDASESHEKFLRELEESKSRDTTEKTNVISKSDPISFPSVDSAIGGMNEKSEDSLNESTSSVFNSTIETSINTSELDDSVKSPAPKKFKRRNQSMYNSND